MTYLKFKNVSIEFHTHSDFLKNKELRPTNTGEGEQPKRYSAPKTIRALDDVSFEINRGDRIALLGRNGAGKSTLLKAAAGIFPPTSGEIEVQGEVAELFNVGLGMRMEATGYRNITLSGLAAGKSREEIEEKVDEIAEFTELGRFLALPIRTYSNGMLLRLKFACSTAFNPDIILMDEWLGAGDAEFRQKANERLTKLVADAGILMLASHNKNMVRRACEKAMYFEHGKLLDFDNVETIIRTMKRAQQQQTRGGQGRRRNQQSA